MKQADGVRVCQEGLRREYRAALLLLLGRLGRLLFARERPAETTEAYRKAVARSAGC